MLNTAVIESWRLYSASRMQLICMHRTQFCIHYADHRGKIHLVNPIHNFDNTGLCTKMQLVDKNLVASMNTTNTKTVAIKQSSTVVQLQ